MIKFGREGRFYFCAAGIGGTPVWTLMDGVENIKVGSVEQEAQVTTRANGRHTATGAVMSDDEIAADLPWDSAAAGFAEFFAAKQSGAIIGVAACDGDIGTAGTVAYIADCCVLDFSRDEQLQDAMKATIKLKPGPSANLAGWHIIGDNSQKATFTAALVDGALTLDLTALPNGGVDGTGQVVSVLRVTNNGANALTISAGAANGISLLAGGTAIVVDPGATVNMTLPSCQTVAAGDKTLDLTGTGTQTSTWEMTFVDP